MKRKAVVLWKVLILVAVAALFLAMLAPLPNRSRHNVRRSACQSNLKSIGLAFAQYNNDYDDKFPLSSRPEGWVGLLQPYINDKEGTPFQCPSEDLRGADNLTDYWFNRRLAGVENKEIADASLTLLGGDGEPSDDPNVSLQLLPPLWAQKEASPARRHLDGANYGFADGHVKWMKPNFVTVEKPNGKPGTFLLR